MAESGTIPKPRGKLSMVTLKLSEGIDSSSFLSSRGNTDETCEEDGRQHTPESGLLSSQWSCGEEPMTSPTDVRDAGLVGQNMDFH
jgi:hypothetical protein